MRFEYTPFSSPPSSLIFEPMFSNCFLLLLHIFIQSDILQATSPDTLPKVDPDPNSKPIKPASKARLLGPCQLCREVIRSFEWCLRETDYSTIDHESPRSEDFTNSEQRLLKVMDLLCSDSKDFTDQCKNFSSKHKQVIEHWWYYNERKEPISLHDYLCVEKGKACCPDGMFGPDCSPCPGYPSSICNAHGTCKGNGTRKGNGHCVCYTMYKGDQCEKCASGYYTISVKDGIEECEKCDKSCLGQCKGPGSKGCHICRDGYIWDAEYGCIDVDECIELGTNPCSENTFCVNTEGAYHCYECDKSCKGCHGDGPDSCKNCATDFVMKEGVCVDTRVKDREANLEKSRYLTYLGLCFATCIIFQKNIYIASGIGLLVALYIGAAEYTVREHAETPHPLENVASQLFG